MTDADITEEVVSTAKRIESYDNPDDLDPLEVKVEASLDGTVREFIAVLGTGGPHIEVRLSDGVVKGYWGGDKHTTHVRNDIVLDTLFERYKVHWESVVA